MKKTVLLASLVACVLFISGCANKAIKNLASVKVIESIPNVSTPKWVEKTTEFWEEKGNFYYRGASEGFTNLIAAQRSAAANAQTKIAEEVKNTVRVEFSQALETSAYDESSGGYLKDIFFSSVDNLTLSGIKITETYAQRLAENTDNGQRIYYRAYSLASLSKEDYKKLAQRAFSDTRAQVAANKSAKELTAETEKRFWASEDKKNDVL